MKGLLSLIEQDTRHIQAPEPPPPPPPEPEQEPEHEPAPEKEPEQKQEPEHEPAPEKTPEQKNYTEEQYNTVGEVNASMFAFCTEAPLNAFNGIYNKLRLRKAKKITDKEKREKEIAKIERTLEANKKVIPLDDNEYRHLQNAFTALAKQKKQAEVNASMLIASAVIGIMVKRVEILIDDE